MHRVIVVGVVAAALLLAACADDDATELSAELSGPAETCENPNLCGGEGSGEATLTFKPQEEEICYDLSVEDVADPNAAHIHAAPEGRPGDVVVDLEFSAEGSNVRGEGCVAAEQDVIEEILDQPADYYVNVHSDEFPDGAARGQLTAA